ncbi:MAG: molecular chaperone DnaJ [Moraxellaceae bacterium]|jgi:hypothetical protein|nr:molecular chaperone DnaJ [Moraxellaceae bacterium]
MGKSKKIRTHYENLQVVESASDEVIRGAYKYLSQKYHPDKNPDNREMAERVFKILNEAHDVLSNPEKRRLHDEWIAQMRASEVAGDAHSSRESARPQKEAERNHPTDTSSSVEAARRPYSPGVLKVSWFVLVLLCAGFMTFLVTFAIFFEHWQSQILPLFVFFAVFTRYAYLKLKSAKAGYLLDDNWVDGFIFRILDRLSPANWPVLPVLVGCLAWIGVGYAFAESGSFSFVLGQAFAYGAPAGLTILVLAGILSFIPYVQENLDVKWMVILFSAAGVVFFQLRDHLAVEKLEERQAEVASSLPHVSGDSSRSPINSGHNALTDYDTMLGELERKHPAINPDSPRFDPAVTEKVANAMSVWQARGLPKEQALRMAVDEVIYGAGLKREQAGARTEVTQSAVQQGGNRKGRGAEDSAQYSGGGSTYPDCEFKNVMTNEDWIKCGRTPPSYDYAK